jgi:hypothetical protein
MKRSILIMAMTLAMAMSANAIGYREASIEATYLTDRMAYELGLSAREYARVYRANLDYLLSVNNRRDLYARNWHSRNSALQIVLSGKQWSLFVGSNYFYRPLSWRNGAFVYNVYSRYPRHHTVKYYSEPRKYKGHKMNYGQWKKQFKHNGKHKGHKW